LSKPNLGQIPTLNKKQRERAIRRLQEIPSKALAERNAKREFERSAKGKRAYHTKGRGVEKRSATSEPGQNTKLTVPQEKSTFFGTRRNAYVGRTIGRGSRPSMHFKRNWFKETTRIVVYMAPNKRDVPRLECLAMRPT
jgi:hypothetical protein